MMEKTFEQLQEERAAVRERFPKILFPDPVLEPVWWGKRPVNRIPDKRAIINQMPDKEGNQRVFAVASDKYKVIHYEDVITMIDETISGITAYGPINICPEVLSDGGKMAVSLKFPDAQYVISHNDGIIPKIDVHTSYDLGWKLSGRFGAFRLKCSNGMGVWENFQRFARRHLLNLNLSDLKNTIIGGFEVFGIQIDSWKSWANTAIGADVLKNMWEMLPFSPKEKEALEVLPEASTGLSISTSLAGKMLTLWDVNNVLTQYTTHEGKSAIRRIELEPVIAKIMGNTYRVATAQ